MKRILCLLILISNSLSAQELNDKLSSDYCHCFNKGSLEINGEINYQLLEECLVYGLKNNAKALEQVVLKDVDTTGFDEETYYKYGYKYGRDLFGNLQEQLIDQCDSYYEYAKKLNATMRQSFVRDASKKALDSLSALVDKNTSSLELRMERGSQHLGLNDFKSAKTDFKQCLEQNPDYFPAQFFLAYTYDLDEDFDNAIKGYQDILDNVIDVGALKDMTKIYLAIVKRKKKEQD
ncbi:hypothetical protein [uncultured Psychroserpens sp.]|uniref:tetratricopeptide repeat protein n=1 Tax=uncultured Psychroserpens sp. TaxID=255436 RepID=UPI00261C78C3|nr:hypothetical protein [uncultured Psychroserpens sp.]